MLNPLSNLKAQIFRFCAVLSIAVSTSITVQAQVQIWGASQQGGSNGIGSLFNVYDNGTDFLIKSEFINSVEGNKPRARVIIGSDGNYYGITSEGGTNNGGTIFRYGVNGFENLYNLNPAADGSNSRGDMLEISPGVFIGTTTNASTNNAGSIFRFSIADGFSTLHTFQPSTEGGNPSGALAYNASTQKLYGTCSSGGTDGFGTCFSYDLNGMFTVQHHFGGGAAGAYPQGGVILAEDGILYGTTQYGGNHSQGSIFKLNPQNDTHEILYHINSTTSDGRYPFGRLVESSPGVFMGTCSEGGTNGTGTVFKVTVEGVYTRLRSLQATNDGGYPKAGLCKTDGALLYGITEFGGLNGFGTIFTITESGIFTKVRDMDYSADGSNAVGTLTFDGNDLVIGAGTVGGANNFGTLFSFSITDQAIDKLHDFSLPLDGSTPVSIYSNGNSFYGITQSGGAFNTGTFYKTELDGSTENLHDFDPETDGQNPNGDLFLAEDGHYYGTARFGGSGNSGTIFKISQTGELTVLHSFDGAAGQFPYGGVIKHSNGKLYGTTVTGGMYGNGVLYSLSEAGDYTVEINFFGFFDGGSPEASLTEGITGMLYGTNSSGGNFNAGTLFQFNPATNAFMVMHHFNSSIEGQIPKSKLLLHSDGKFYATTSSGLAGGGAIYRYSPESGIEVLHEFSTGTDGMDCSGGLVEDEFGVVYGFCTFGGALNLGTCFSYSETGGFQTIYSFSSSAQYPTGAPALFFPECYGNDGCETENACAVAVCNYGICEEVNINPVFTALNVGDCQIGLDVYDLSLQISMDIHSGGLFIVANDTLELIDGVNSYSVTISDLPSDGNDIILDYIFEETGCAGTTGTLGIAPDPCPPVLMTFILDAGNLDVSPEGIHIGGSFQGWTPSQYPMALNDDGFWEATLTIGSGEHEFNFFNGSSLFDGEYVIGQCAMNGKRLLTVGEESETLSYCWANCDINCSVGLRQSTSLIDFTIIPNIINSGGIVNVYIPSMNTQMSYAVINITGKVISTGKISSDKTAINTGSLTPGIYNLLIFERSEKQIAGVKRFVVQ